MVASLRRDRLDKRQLFEALRRAGYAGGYDAVRRYARRWADIRATKTEAKASEAFIPLTFAPAEAYQFDWSEEWIVLDGIAFKAQVAHARLCHSRMPYIRAYPRQSQEMMFDAHARAFAFWGGACERGIYDNMKTAVDAVFVGKERKFNRRFAQMCSHYLVEPTACTPAAGWEKGQVENQVGSLRQRLFIPRPHVKTLEELNRQLEDGCIAYARESRHPDDRERTVWEAFEAERPALVPIREALRRIPRGRCQRLEDLPGPLRSQPLQHRGQGRQPAGPAAGLCRSGRRPLRWRGGGHA